MADSSSSTKAAAATARPAPSTPWTKIVRGAGDPVDPIAPAPHSPPPAPKSTAAAAVADPAAASPAIGDEEDGGGPENFSAPNGNVGKRPAWSPPSNGPEAGAPMEAQSWPALAESVKTPAKPSSDSVKGLADDLSSISLSQGTDAAPPQKQAGEQRHGNSSLNHSVPNRQRSMKRNGASSGGVLPQAPALPEQSAEMQPRLSPRYHNPRGNFASHSHGGNDHPRQQRNSFRRNGGMHARGDGFHHQNFGSRHDQERGNQEWNSHRNFGNNRDPQQRAIPGPIRPPPPPPIPYAPFPPSAVWPFGPMGFPEVASPLYYVQGPPQDLRGVPFPLSPQPVYFPPMDPLLPTKILHQIEYYFSEENLIKDTYLRQNMDEQGWVPISLIAGFKKVSNLTDNKNLILDSIQGSAVVEVQGDKVRRTNDWMRWIMPSSFQGSSSTTPQVP
ncbi:la-related protein 1C isoform X2 [Punica granatum]|uniref:La-related protein 1C isoform X2 n=1 Tax=Punica granatum TaxID=22663 RepID=A0A218W0X1_PUNGR|nr:la-related protein 1C isoform X2 [Punica granatum]OWM66467.1 hypothetical protein CDL15_Pgr013684 [Punica granatum]